MIRYLHVFECLAVCLRSVDGGKPLDGSVKVIESLILNKKGNLSVHAAKRFVFFDQQHSVCFADKKPKWFPCQRSNGAQVDDLGGNRVFPQGFSYLKRGVNGFPMRNDRKIRSFSNNVGFSEGNEIFIIRNFPRL